MKTILAELQCGDADVLDILSRLVDALRPGYAKKAPAIEYMQQLITTLQTSPELRQALCRALLQLFSQRHAVLLFATSGIYPETSVYTESRRRFSHKLLPEADDNIQLKHIIARLFRRSDAQWLKHIPLETWLQLLQSLHIEDEGESEGLQCLQGDVLEALRVVAHRIAAAGLEPEMLQLEPALENHASPFLALCEEALLLVNALEVNAAPHYKKTVDESHMPVLIDQARRSIERVRRKAQQMGASFHLTFRLKRLAQHLDRLEQLAAIIVAHHRGETAALQARVAGLWRELLLAECCRNDLRSFWQQNAELVALRVTENAGKSGEHYITESRSEYFSMLLSAVGGGIVIALMAANKVFMGKLGLPPLTEVILFSLNYGIGFVLIHILHFSVATKQPAMTANAIAAAIGEVEDNKRSRQRNMEPLVTLVARTVRTQLIAIVGNIGMAIPVAMLFGYGIFYLTGEQFVSTAKAITLLNDSNPLASAVIVYAAIAGVCLFLAGLIAGYYDNLCAYNRIPERLYQLRWLQRLFGKQHLQRFTGYISNNLGALAGNFFFGCLLGGVSGAGVLLGLPVDIRHIAFSSAYWGYAITALEFHVEWQLALLAATGVVLTGLTNLAVSFYLAMWVALKSRGVNLGQRMTLAKAVWQRFVTSPREFLLPPSTAPASTVKNKDKPAKKS